MFLQRALRRPASVRATTLTLFASLVLAVAPAARAGQPAIGPLNPEPQDFYSCQATGGGAICRATLVEPYELEPLGVWCGSGADAFEVLDSGTRIVHATRWYDRDGNIVRRLRTNLFRDASLSNPLTGATISYAQHNTDIDEFSIPGDLDSAAFTGHGVLSISAPGFGVVILEAGVVAVSPTGDLEHQAGPSDLSDYFNGDASAADDLCAALGAG